MVLNAEDRIIVEQRNIDVQLKYETEVLDNESLKWDSAPASKAGGMEYVCGRGRDHEALKD